MAYCRRADHGTIFLGAKGGRMDRYAADRTVKRLARRAGIGAGTVIRRRSTRFETPTEGTMEITEFEPERTMKVRTHDGPMTINGWAFFATPSQHQTQLTIGGEFPGTDDSMKEIIRPLMERSAANIKALIETET